MAEKGLSLNTRSAYRSDLFMWHTFLKKNDQNLRTALPGHVRAYLQDLNEKNITPASVARSLSSLRSFYAFLKEETDCSIDPLDGIATPKIPKKLPAVLTVTEVEMLFRTAQKDCSFRGLRLQACLALFYTGGLRISEALALKVSMITPLLQRYKILTQHKPGTKKPHTPPLIMPLMIRGKGSKEREIFLPPGTIETLQAYDDARRETSAHHVTAFFSSGHNKALSRQSVFMDLKRLALTSGLNAESLSPHVLRHAFATHLLAGGADLITLQKLLGHTHIATTEIYTHICHDTLHDTLVKKHPLETEKT